jgi:KDO2-lipid IV(A) lauroyltransferase
MKLFKYFFQFFSISILLIFFKIVGLRLSRIIAGKLFLIFGPYFRSKKIIERNISNVFSNNDQVFKRDIINEMWKSYGKIMAEYMFMKYFRTIDSKKFLEIKGQEILEKVKISNDPVIFVSGHFDNFELMAMHIEKSGIDLATIYRPLNNIFLNPIMENIRKRYICCKQVRKGVSGTKKILKYFKSGTSIALMIDQRVSQGIQSKLFGKNALTTTIPAQFVKKFNCKIVPIYIERKNNEKFILEIMKPINFNKNQNIENITLMLNELLEKMIIRNPYQWIWSHNRWK